MQIQKVLEHTCFQPKGKGPLSPSKCRCRKYVTAEQAKTKVALGISRYVEVGRKNIEYEESCTHCTEALRKSCKVCNGTGAVKKTKVEPVLGDDIISTVSPTGLRNLTVKVKKSPTIESKHILRGIEDSNKGYAARERWDEYHLLTLKQRVRLLSEMTTAEEFDAIWKIWTVDMSQPFPLELRSEPVDDPKTGTGRLHDYGRGI